MYIYHIQTLFLKLKCMNKVLAYLSRGHHTNTIQLLPIVFFFFCHWYQIFRLLHFIQDFNNWEATGECHASCSMFSYGWIYTSRTWQKVCAYCFLRSLKKALNGACLTEVSHFHLFALSPISSHPTVTAMRYADCQTCESVVPVLPVQVVTCIALQCMADLRQSSFLCVVTLHLERVIL